MDKRLSIITLLVADLARSRDFYNATLGWSELEPVQEGIAFYQMPGIQFALYPQESFATEKIGNASPPQGFTMAHNFNSREEVDSFFEFLEAKKVPILKKPEEVFWGGYSGYFNGPDGELWEVAHNPFTKVNDDGTYGG